MERNQLDGLEEAGILRDVRLPLFRWSLEQIEDLAALSGMSVNAVLERNPGMIPSVRQPGSWGLLVDGPAAVGGHAMEVAKLVDLPRRFCPSCFALSRHHRPEWDVRAIQHCHAHGQSLQWSCPSCLVDQSWRAGMLATCGCGFDLAHARPVPIPVTALPLVALLDGLFRRLPVPVPPGLEGLHFPQAVDVLDEAGALATGRSSALDPNARRPDTTFALSEGLALLQAGSAAVAMRARLQCMRVVDSASDLPTGGLASGTGSGPRWNSYFSGRQAALVFERALRLEAIGTPGTRSLAASIRHAIGVEQAPEPSATGRFGRSALPDWALRSRQPELPLTQGTVSRPARAVVSARERAGAVAAGLRERETYAVWAAGEIFRAGGDEGSAIVLVDAAARATTPQELDDILDPPRPPPKPGYVRFVRSRPLLDMLLTGRRLWDTHVADPSNGDGMALARAELDSLIGVAAETQALVEAAAVKLLGENYKRPGNGVARGQGFPAAEPTLEDERLEEYEGLFRRAAAAAGLDDHDVERVLAYWLWRTSSAFNTEDLGLLAKVLSAPGNTEEQSRRLLAMVTPGVESLSRVDQAGAGQRDVADAK